MLLNLNCCVWWKSQIQLNTQASPFLWLSMLDVASCSRWCFSTKETAACCCYMKHGWSQIHAHVKENLFHSGRLSNLGKKYMKNYMKKIAGHQHPLFKMKTAKLKTLQRRTQICNCCKRTFHSEGWMLMNQAVLLKIYKKFWEQLNTLFIFISYIMNWI